MHSAGHRSHPYDATRRDLLEQEVRFEPREVMTALYSLSDRVSDVQACRGRG